MRPKNYHNYLINRKLSGFFYRFFIIYPFFLKYLGKNNLDFGCGIGDFLRFCSFLNINIVGCDINKNLVEYCENQGFKSFHLTQANKKFFFKNPTFDCICMDNVLEHILNPSPIISFISNSIKQGGYLIVGVPVGEAGFNYDPDHKIYYDEVKLDNILLEFSLLKINSFYRPFKNSWLRKNMRQFCYYAVYKKT